MSKFLKQFERVKRSLRKIEIENQDRDSTEYDDDLWHFFQDCHHLKDWIINDPDIPDEVKGIETKVGENIEKFVSNNKELRVCADLANRSKHLELTRHSREDAKVTSRNVNIDLNLGTSTCEHIITLGNGRKRIALDVAREAVEAWESFLSENNLNCEVVPEIWTGS